MNRRTTRDKNRRENAGETRFKFKIKDVNVVRLLVCFLIALNVLLLYAIFFSSNGLPGYTKQNEQVRELEEKILKLKQENQKLYELIQAFKKDPKLREKLVRQELGWVKESEVILEFPEKENNHGANRNIPAKRPVPAR